MEKDIFWGATLLLYCYKQQNKKKINKNLKSSIVQQIFGEGIPKIQFLCTEGQKCSEFLQSTICTPLYPYFIIFITIK